MITVDSFVAGLIIIITWIVCPYFLPDLSVNEYFSVGYAAAILSSCREISELRIQKWIHMQIGL